LATEFEDQPGMPVAGGDEACEKNQARLEASGLKFRAA